MSPMDSDPSILALYNTLPSVLLSYGHSPVVVHVTPVLVHHVLDSPLGAELV